MTRFNAQLHAGQTCGPIDHVPNTTIAVGRQKTPPSPARRAVKQASLALLGGVSLAVLTTLTGGNVAYAECIGTTTNPLDPPSDNYVGTNNVDNVTCDNQVPNNDGSIQTFGGNDTILIEGGIFNGGFVGVQPGDGDDIVTMTDGTVVSILDNSGVNGGRDTFILSGGFVGNNGSGNPAAISGNDNDDIYIITGTVVLGGIDEGSLRTGDDIVTMSGGTVTGTMNLGLGSDTITLTGGTIGDGTLGPGDGNVRGGDARDTIVLNGGFVSGEIDGDQGDDLINVLNGSVYTVRGDVGDDSINIKGGTANFVRGDTGSDTITLTSGAVLDSVFGNDDEDSITLNGATVGGAITGGNGDDMIRLTAGTVGPGVATENSDVRGGANDDLIILEGAFVSDDIDGDSGDDTINLESGTVADSVFGDIGNDIIRLSGAQIDGDIRGNAGRDTIILTSGTVGPGVATDGSDVFGGADGDTIILAGAFVSDDIDGDSGDDTINLTSGTVADSVFGDDGDDSITLSGAQVGIVGGSGDLVGNGNDDQIVWSGGDLTGGIYGDNRNTGGELASDRVTVTNPTASLEGRVLEGDSGDGGNVDALDGKIDILRLDGWTGNLTGATITNWEIMQIAGGTATFVDGGLTVGSNSDQAGLFIEGDGAAAFTQSFDLTGNLINGGLVDLTSDGGATDTVLRVSGVYAADGDIALDAVLNDGDDPDDADLLRVDGNTTGFTRVFITNQGGLGAETGDGETDGILVVSVGGISDGSFVLSEELLAGIFEYDLLQADGQNWYLQSAFLDQAFPYESLPSALQSIGHATVGQLVERVGVRSALAAGDDAVIGSQPVASGVWARAVGLSLESDGNIDSTTGATFDQTIGFIQGGAEAEVMRRDSGRLLVGIMGHWGTSSLDTNDTDGAGRGGADIDLFGGGINVTWYGASGLYLDSVFQYTAYDVDFSTATRWASTTTDGDGYALSQEVGYRLPISDDFAIVPQAQLIWQSIDFDDFTDPDGVRVSLNDGDSLVGRLGVAMEGNQLIGSALVTGYAEANLLYEFMGDNEVQAAATPLSQDVGGTSAEVGFGGTVAVTEGVSIYAEIDYTIPFDGGVRGVQASGGVRWSW